MSHESLKASIKRRLPAPLLIYRMLQKRNWGDALSAMRFLAERTRMASIGARLRLLQRIYEADLGILCVHSQDEMLQVVKAILDVPADIPGCVVEAGCFKGGSTAKFSTAAKLTGRKLVVFDSFEGLPENDEAHQRTIFGDEPDFSRGRYRGSLGEVQRNVMRYGEAKVCEYVKGWFEDTMPHFSEPVVAAYIDVDLVSSTTTCIRHLYPLLQPGGSLFSQDGHLPLIIELLRDAEFWEDKVGCAMPEIEGLGTRKLVRIRKSVA